MDKIKEAVFLSVGIIGYIFVTMFSMFLHAIPWIILALILI